MPNIYTYIRLMQQKGLVNRVSPRLFFDTNRADMDFPASDRHWADYLARHRGVTFNTSVPPTLCDLLVRLTIRPLLFFVNLARAAHLCVAFTI